MPCDILFDFGHNNQSETESFRISSEYWVPYFKQVTCLLFRKNQEEIGPSKLPYFMLAYIALICVINKKIVDYSHTCS